MNAQANLPLVCAAGLSALAALLHLAIIVGGAPWYRFFGAGARMSAAAAAGHRGPALLTACIALTLLAWSAYALSGAGVIGALPMRKAALTAITGIYLARGLAILPLACVARFRLSTFWVWSSAVCLVFGLVHLTGLIQVWTRL